MAIKSKLPFRPTNRHVQGLFGAAFLSGITVAVMGIVWLVAGVPR